MTAAAKHDVRMPDGSIRKMTAKEISEACGIDVGVIRRRLNRPGGRSWEKLTESAESGRRAGRQAFLRGTEAIFAERARERAAEAAHEERVRSGNPEI